MIEVEIERLIWRGRGIGRIKGGKRAIILPPVLPGEVIKGKIIREKKDYVEIRPLSILEASPHRISHPCPYGDKCGGCSFGFIDPGEQIKIKKQILLQELKRHLNFFFKHTLGIPIKIYPSPDMWEYRWRGQVIIKEGSPHFKELASHRLIPFDKCMLFSPPINEALPLICQDLPKGRLTIAASPITSQVYTHKDKGPLFLPVKGIPFPLKIHPSCFFQANQGLNTKLIEWVDKKLQEESTLLDLFAGSGNFALPLAYKGKQVVMVEKDPLALKAAKEFARENNIPIVIQKRDLFTQGITDVLNSYTPTATIVDPPRVGGKKVAIELGKYKNLNKIIWISCDVVNTCRDISVLLQEKWHIEEIALFDMFPQTYHMEVVFVLVKTKERKQ